MKVVIPGGSGQLGRVLARALIEKGHQVVVLSRGGRSPARIVPWDGKTLGPWAEELDGADVVVNLTGRTVNCRYTEENLRQMMDSRVDSARVVGEAIAAAARPPKVWLQASTATIYAHTYGAPHTEADGVLGGDEPDVPAYWSRSTDIAKNWERAQREAPTPETRKVQMRTSYAMSPDEGGIFDVLFWLARRGLGGPVAGGGQYISWIHDADMLGAVLFLIERDDVEGPVNLAAPNPLPQREVMAELRRHTAVKVGLPIAKWMAELGAIWLRTDTELILKSRRVAPAVLLEKGFTFRFPEWPTAAADLVSRWPIAE